MRPFVVSRRQIVEGGVTPMRVVPAFNELEHCHAGLDLALEPAAGRQLAFQVAKKLSHIALSKQSPTEPIEGRTPTSRQREPNWIEGYWVPWSE